MEPFGEINQTLTSTIDNPFRFPGQYEDDLTGLYYNHHRYYMPGLGRYNRVDIFESSSFPYIYSFNNSITFYDRLGLKEENCCWKIEGFPSEAAYENCKIDWDKKNPGFIGPYDTACGAAAGVIFSRRANPNWNDKYKHCWVGCQINNYCNAQAVIKAAWYKEWKDLTDCVSGTHFDPADYYATVAGAHKNDVDCDKYCRSKGYNP